MEPGSVPEGQRAGPRIVLAGNPGPFTLDGTRTYIVGVRRVAIIDPGPKDESHLRALLRAVRDAEEIRILLTHGHSDHAGGAALLARECGAGVWGPPSALLRVAKAEETTEGRTRGGVGSLVVLSEGDGIGTDEGDLEVLETPGHTRDHLSFRWRKTGALFPGDLVLGRGATTWLGEYPGCVADYLESLRKIRERNPSVLYPAHGPPILSPMRILSRFEDHRMARLLQIQTALEADPGATAREISLSVYGSTLPPSVARAAEASVEAMIHHLRQDRR